jgi:CheY-like chemotaxis protein
VFGKIEFSFVFSIQCVRIMGKGLLAGRRQVLWAQVITGALLSTLCGCIIFARVVHSHGDGGANAAILGPEVLYINFAVWGCLFPVVVDFLMDLFVRSAKNIFFIERNLLMFGSCIPLLIINIFVRSNLFTEILMLCVVYQSMWSVAVYSSVFAEAAPVHRLLECIWFVVYCGGLTMLVLSSIMTKTFPRQVLLYVGVCLGGLYILHFVFSLCLRCLKRCASKRMRVRPPKNGVGWKVGVSSVMIFMLGSLSYLSVLSIVSSYVNYCATEILTVYFGIVAVGNIVFVTFVASVRFDVGDTGSMVARQVSTDFVRYVSHEIRTPLNVAAIGMELIHGDATPGGTLSTLAIQVQQAITEANSILQNVTDYEELISGKISINKTTVSALEACKGAVDAAILKTDFALAQNEPPSSLIQFDNGLVDDFTTIFVDEGLLMRAMINSIMGAVNASCSAEKVFVSLTNVESSVVITITNRHDNVSAGSSFPELRSYVKFDDEYNFCLFPGAYNPEHDLGLFIANTFVRDNGGEYLVSHVTSLGQVSQVASSTTVAVGESTTGNRRHSSRVASTDLMCTITIPVRDFSNALPTQLDSEFGAVFSPTNPNARSPNTRKKFSISARIHSELNSKINGRVLDSVPEGQGESRSSSLRSSRSNVSGDVNQAQRPTEKIDYKLWREMMGNKLFANSSSSGNDSGNSSKSNVSAVTINKSVMKRNITDLFSSSSGSADKTDESSSIFVTGRTWSSSRMSVQTATPENSTKEDHSGKVFTRSNRLKHDSPLNSTKEDEEEGSAQQLLDKIQHQRHLLELQEQFEKANRPSNSDDIGLLTRSYSDYISTSFKGFDAVSTNPTQEHGDVCTVPPSKLDVIDEESRWLHGRKILVVADSMSFRNEMCLYLAQHGASAMAAVDEVDALSKLLSAEQVANVDSDLENSNDSLKTTVLNSAESGTEIIFVGYTFSNGNAGHRVCRKLREFFRGPIVGILESSDPQTGKEDLLVGGCTFVFTRPLLWASIKQSLSSVL